jgi:hypothetical protein
MEILLNMLFQNLGHMLFCKLDQTLKGQEQVAWYPTPPEYAREEPAPPL